MTLSHNVARDALATAYRNLYHREPTKGELDFGLSTANFETGYGRAGGQFARWAAEGKYNWGALESGSPGPEKTFNNFKAAGLHPTKEKGSDANRPAYFYLFPNDVEAATAFLMTWGRNGTLQAAASGDPKAVAEAMKKNNYYEGFHVGPGKLTPSMLEANKKGSNFIEEISDSVAHQKNIADYANALKNQVKVVSSDTPIAIDKNQAVANNGSVIDRLLSKIDNFISNLLGKTAMSKNNFVVTAYGTDYQTKAEYFRILQSVLQEEIGITSSIHHSNENEEKIELECQMPFGPLDNAISLKEICAAVQDTFELATNGFMVIPVISSRKSEYPQMNPKTAEINRRKFRYKLINREVIQ